MKLARTAKKAAKSVLYDLSLGTVLGPPLFRRYLYMHQPHQLEFLMQALRETKSVPGSILEVGCAYGATTIFLKKFLDHLGSERPYLALDTFSGFVPVQARHDIEELGMDDALEDDFKPNKRAWVAESLRLASVEGVELIEGDATAFDYDRAAPIAFCLLDVDLYKPIQDILPKIHDRLSPGGMIVVDDCQDHEKWGGAYQAYREFAADRQIEPEVVCNKFGILRRPPGIGVHTAGETNA